MAELKESRAAFNPGSAAPTTLCAGCVGHATFDFSQMFSRNILVITAALLCHSIAPPMGLTSELPPPVVAAAGEFRQIGWGLQEPAALPLISTLDTAGMEAVAPLLAAPEMTAAGEAVTIQARQQEKQGETYKLHGDVEIHLRGLIFKADDIVYDASSGEVVATGNVTLDGGPHDEHIAGSRAAYNVKNETGKFYDVTGSTGARFRGRNVTLTTSNPFSFTGKLVEKVSDERYVIHDGTVTSCELPTPKWVFSATTIIVDVGDKAKIYNSTFRLKGVPILYFPYASHPVEKLGRQSGLLTPSFGVSSRKGFIATESLYLRLGRSADATLGGEYWSHRGWAQHGEFRARPSETSFVNMSYFGVLDRGTKGVDQGGEDIKLDAEALLRHDIRAVADLNYLSSFVFRLAFTETFAQAVDSEVKSSAFLSKNYQGFSFNTRMARYQNFQSVSRGDLVTILHVPSFEVSSVERQLGRSPLYWSFDAAAEGVSRREPGFVTDKLVGRLDLNPRLSLPLFLDGWSFRPEIGFRETYYTQGRTPVGGIGSPSKADISRRAVEASLEMRPPVLQRVFDRTLFGRTVKHTVQPRFVYRYANGVDNFNSIIRFDARDILSNTNEIEYGLVNRLYLKRNGCAQPGEVRPNIAPVTPALRGVRSQEKDLPALEPRKRSGQAAEVAEEVVDCGALPDDFITWELGQKYFFDPNFGGAVVNGRRNVLTTTADFTGIAFLTEPRRFSTVISRLRVRTSANTDLQWHIDYDAQKGRINSSTAFVNLRLADFFVGGSHAMLHAPGEIFVSSPIPGPTKFNQFRILAGYGSPNKMGASVAGNVGFDANFGFLQYSALQTAYNWDCCGVSVEYRRFALGSVRNENQFRFAFTLANVGTFGNLKRQERLF